MESTSFRHVITSPGKVFSPQEAVYTRDSRFSRLGTETPRLSVKDSSRSRNRTRIFKDFRTGIGLGIKLFIILEPEPVSESDFEGCGTGIGTGIGFYIMVESESEPESILSFLLKKLS